MRTKLVNGNMLAFLSKNIGFDAFALISQQIEANEGRQNKNVLEDTFESFIAAIFLDFNEKKITKQKPVDPSKPYAAHADYSGMGFQIAERWIIGVLEEWVDFADLVNTNQNYKDLLIKYYQHSVQSIPRFLEVDVSMEGNKKMFTICIKDSGDSIIGVGKADSKKKAEQLAAHKALVYLGQLSKEMSVRIDDE